MGPKSMKFSLVQPQDEFDSLIQSEDIFVFSCCGGHRTYMIRGRSLFWGHSGVPPENQLELDSDTPSTQIMTFSWMQVITRPKCQ